MNGSGISPGHPIGATGAQTVLAAAVAAWRTPGIDLAHGTGPAPALPGLTAR
jgi:acetyl-CoA acetyltransferase